jgi:hypothetical protein
MSRINIIYPRYYEFQYDIIIGWDVQLQSFFSYVERMEDEELLAEIGPFPGTDLHSALNLLEPFIPGISTNVELVDMLEQLKEENVGNFVTNFRV